MLDLETKRRIDTARDILVGKLPDPKSQIEQITIALIYKFMDDLDAESAEMGGERRFFTGGFAKYGWAKLMSSGLGGQDKLDLYVEAIQRMPENPNIPQLFREIFKNAYLPYRDPETLRLFLKTIDEFQYDHSERLGDAFEYLLLVMGSQGDAGQFRTPRHIIDFIVAIVDPKKDERILDPACGTAGFLISAYKHILVANRDPEGESTLTPDEKERLARNVLGYDISPDMVRLSLVNLYLHRFTDPHIHEYDTLTSEERWGEYADVILANPPFMSPKGGINPHTRFTVQSKRSEVLFVDYIAEHLTAQGRAGIIVPEGIIFQSQTAYKGLRKLLVEQSLVAVISLPAGVFNPYSGVKTSILILDKGLAKQADSVAFFKVEHDGFGLGAQRRPVEQNDLPQVQAEIEFFLSALRRGEPAADVVLSIGKTVAKERIAAGGEYNLSGERYQNGGSVKSAWPIVSVADVFSRRDQAVLPETMTGTVTYIGLENIEQQTGNLIGSVTTDTPSEIKSTKNLFGENDILYGKLRPNLNKVWLSDRVGICSTDIFVIQADERQVIPALYAHIFRSPKFNQAVTSQLKGAQLPRIGWSSFAELPIPLPPFDVQQEIVAEIESYQRIIEGAHAVVENYRPTVAVQPEWLSIEFGEICDFKNGLNFDRTDSGYTVSIIGVSNFRNYLYAPIEDLAEVHLSTPVSQEYLVQEDDILFVRSNGNPDLVGRSVIVPRTLEPTTFSGFTIRARIVDQRAMPEFLGRYFKTREFADKMKTVGRGASIKNLSQGLLGEIKIPLPPLPVQQQIVADLQTEQSLVDANREVMKRFNRKIQTVLDRIWSNGLELDGVQDCG